MGKPVTLDSDDVEILLNAAAAIRHVENALEAVRQDPAMIRLYESGKIGQALDRCNRARAHAIKPEFYGPPKNWEPDYEQYRTMTTLYTYGPQRVDPGYCDELRNYGLVVLGQRNAYVNWGDKTQEMIGADPVLMAKITPEGRRWIESAYNKRGLPETQNRDPQLPMKHPGSSLHD